MSSALNSSEMDNFLLNEETEAQRVKMTQREQRVGPRVALRHTRFILRTSTASVCSNIGKVLVSEECEGLTGSWEA